CRLRRHLQRARRAALWDPAVRHDGAQLRDGARAGTRGLRQLCQGVSAPEHVAGRYLRHPARSRKRRRGCARAAPGGRQAPGHPTRQRRPASAQPPRPAYPRPAGTRRSSDLRQRQSRRISDRRTGPRRCAHRRLRRRHRDGGQCGRAGARCRLQAGRVSRRAADEDFDRESHAARAQAGLSRLQRHRRLLRRSDRAFRGEPGQCCARVPSVAGHGAAAARTRVRRRQADGAAAHVERQPRALSGIVCPPGAALQGPRTSRHLPGASERRAQRAADQREAARGTPPGLKRDAPAQRSAHDTSPFSPPMARHGGVESRRPVPDCGGAEAFRLAPGESRGMTFGRPFGGRMASVFTPRREALALLALALVLGASLRFYRLAHGDLGADDGASWAAASAPELRAVVETEHNLDPGKLALYDILLHGWIAVFGDGTFAMRAMSATLGTLAIVLVFAAVREVVLSFAEDPSRAPAAARAAPKASDAWAEHGERGPTGDLALLAAAFAAVLYATNAGMVTADRAVRMYPLVMVAELLEILFFVRAQRRGGLGNYVGVALCTAAMIAANFTASFLL